MTEIFPWQTALWISLIERYQKSRLPHAFLFEGNKGIGKTHFAHTFAALLLCQMTDRENACGECRSCDLLKTELHPDLTDIKPEGLSQTIKIDQIRSLNEYIVKTAHFRGYRVVIISSADKMNQAASNALLKTLEEPPPQVVFILLTDSPHRISPTIRSRCEKITFPQPNADQVKTWLTEKVTAASTQNYSIEFLLRLAQQSPLEAFAFIENDDLAWRDKLITDFEAVISKKLNPLSLSERYKTLPLAKLFFWATTFVTDLIRLKTGANDRLMHVDQIDLLTSMNTQFTVADLYSYLDTLYTLTNQVARGLNLNHGLAVDQVFCGLETDRIAIQ